MIFWCIDYLHHLCLEKGWWLADVENVCHSCSIPMLTMIIWSIKYLHVHCVSWEGWMSSWCWDLFIILCSTPMLQTQIVKTGIEDTKGIEIVPAKTVGMRSLKTVNLEKMGRSIRLCFYLQDLSVLTTVPCHVLNCCYFVLFCLITD